jgi:hypothetical protein
MVISPTNWVGFLSWETGPGIVTALKERFDTVSFRTTIQDTSLREDCLLTSFHDARQRNPQKEVFSLLGSDAPIIFVDNHLNVSILVIEAGSLVILNPFGLIVVKKSLEPKNGGQVPDINCLFCEEQATVAFSWGAEACKEQFLNAMRGGDPSSRISHIIANHDKAKSKR